MDSQAINLDSVGPEVTAVFTVNTDGLFYFIMKARGPPGCLCKSDSGCETDEARCQITNTTWAFVMNESHEKCSQVADVITEDQPIATPDSSGMGIINIVTIALVTVLVVIVLAAMAYVLHSRHSKQSSTDTNFPQISDENCSEFLDRHFNDQLSIAMPTSLEDPSDVLTLGTSHLDNRSAAVSSIIDPSAVLRIEHRPDDVIEEAEQEAEYAQIET